MYITRRNGGGSMKKIYLLIGISCLFANELEVDGDLTVTGNIQAGTIDSVQQTIIELQAQIASLQSQITFLQQQLGLIDCMGVVGGDAEIDCNGVCNGGQNGDYNGQGGNGGAPRTDGFFSGGAGGKGGYAYNTNGQNGQNGLIIIQW